VRLIVAEAIIDRMEQVMLHYTTVPDGDKLRMIQDYIDMYRKNRDKWIYDSNGTIYIEWGFEVR
jgi:hypothetical protein